MYVSSLVNVYAATIQLFVIVYHRLILNAITIYMTLKVVSLKVSVSCHWSI
jgi:hypothetical protein